MKKSLSVLLLCALLVVPIVSVGATPSFTLAQGGWLTGWDYRLTYNITGATGAGTDHQVFINVSHFAFMQADFDDLRATDNDGTTLLDAWLERKTDSSFAEIWIEVADSLATDTQIYLYCGNSTVSNYWDGPATFLLFDDFEDNSFNTTLWNDQGTGSVTETDGRLTLLGNPDGTIAVESDEFFSQDVAIGAYVYFWEMRAVGFGDYQASPAKLNYVESYNDWHYCAEGANSATDSYDFVESSWQNIEVLWYNGSYSTSFVNRTLATEISSSYVPNDDMPVLFHTYDPDDEYLLVEWTYVRKLADSTQPSIELVGEWANNGEETFGFIVIDPTVEWGIDVFFVLAGLIAIPCSTVYLFVTVRKGNMNTDKLLIFLLAFMVGLGLFVGGIMP